MKWSKDSKNIVVTKLTFGNAGSSESILSYSLIGIQGILNMYFKSKNDTAVGIIFTVENIADWIFCQVLLKKRQGEL